jgi:hypothetical protein
MTTELTDDPGMYGSAVNKASDLLYEVGSWLEDLLSIHAAEPDVMYDALIDRLVPTADAALDEVRQYRAERDALIEFAQWLARMDDPASAEGLADRRSVTLTIITDRARAVLAERPE